MASEILRTDTPADLVNNKKNLIFTCDGLKSQSDSIRLKNTMMISRLLDLRSKIEKEAKDFDIQWHKSNSRDQGILESLVQDNWSRSGFYWLVATRCHWGYIGSYFFEVEEWCRWEWEEGSRVESRVWGIGWYGQKHQATVPSGDQDRRISGDYGASVSSDGEKGDGYANESPSKVNFKSNPKPGRNVISAWEKWCWIIVVVFGWKIWS